MSVGIRALLPAAWLLVCGGIAACDLDFVAVDETPPAGDSLWFAQVDVRSEQTQQLRAYARVFVGNTGGKAAVTVNGIPADSTRLVGPDGGGLRAFYATLHVDSLDPRVRVVIRPRPGAAQQVLDVPLAGRAGPARWLSDGGLFLPLRLPFVPSPPEGSAQFAVRLDDADGSELAALEVRGAIPDSLVLPESLVPAGARRARILVAATWGLREPGMLLAWMARSEVDMAVPPRAALAGAAAETSTDPARDPP